MVTKYFVLNGNFLAPGCELPKQPTVQGNKIAIHLHFRLLGQHAQVENSGDRMLAQAGVRAIAEKVGNHTIFNQLVNITYKFK